MVAYINDFALMMLVVLLSMPLLNAGAPPASRPAVTPAGQRSGSRAAAKRRLIAIPPPSFHGIIGSRVAGRGASA